MLQEDFNFRSESKTDRYMKEAQPKSFIGNLATKKLLNVKNIKFPSSFQNEPVIKIKPIDLCEFELFSYLTDYSFQIPVSLAYLFMIESSELLKIREDLALEINLLEINISKKEGLAITFVERNINDYRRMNIVHFSTINQSFYAKCLEKLIKYISEKDFCNEIKIWMKNNSEKKNEFNEIENIFKEIGFAIMNISPEFTIYRMLIGNEINDDQTKKKS
jgi:hypothetical protein